MSLLRSSSLGVFGAVVRTPTLVAARGVATSAVRRTDDPKVLNKDTHSGASVKADKHDKDPKTLQQETARAANTQDGSSTGSRVTASPNNNPTDSEDAINAEKTTKSPQELQKETTEKLHS